MLTGHGCMHETALMMGFAPETVHLERLGIVHILVNDQTIKSWVDPYEE